MSLILPDDLERAAADYASLVALDRLEEAGPQAEPARTKADFFSLCREHLDHDRPMQLDPKIIWNSGTQEMRPNDAEVNSLKE